jgi:hypothetical protein
MLEEKTNKIYINGNPVQVSAKRLTFFDVQAIAPLFASGDMDFSNYWRYAFYNWLRYSPSIEVESLTPEEGKALADLLPEPSQVMEWLVFREAKSATSSDTSTTGVSVTDFATNEKGWSTF